MLIELGWNWKSYVKNTEPGQWLVIWCAIARLHLRFSHKGKTVEPPVVSWFKAQRTLLWYHWPSSINTYSCEWSATCEQASWMCLVEATYMGDCGGENLSIDNLSMLMLGYLISVCKQSLQWVQFCTFLQLFALNNHFLCVLSKHYPYLCDIAWLVQNLTHGNKNKVPTEN